MNMIEFTPDGPFADKAEPLFPDRVRMIGLGQTGAAVCDQLVLHGRPSQDLWVFDSDQQTVESSVVPNRHLLGRDLVHGLGCGGDLDLAREIVALEENQLAPLAHDCDFLVLVVGLAGATGVAIAEHLIHAGRQTGAKVIVIGVLPFAFEGLSRRERAIEAIAALRREADSVLVLSHDRLSDDPAVAKNIRRGFHIMHQLMAQTVQALAQVVCKRGLIQLSFADVRSLYGRYAGSEALENCWIGHVEGDIHDRIEDLIQHLLDSPLLADESIWKHVDHAIVTVSGTRDLGLTDVQELVGALKARLPIRIPIATSASLDEESNEKVRMTVLLAMTAPVSEEMVDPTPAEKRPVNLTKTAPLPELAKTAALPPPAKIVKVKAPRPPAAPKPKAKPAPVVEEPVFAEETAEVELVPMAPIESEEAAEVRLTAAARYQAKQEEMQFEPATRGRFEKTHETMYNGENLDQPTFRRRRIEVRL
jgi:cell division protein FtsZ